MRKKLGAALAVVAMAVAAGVALCAVGDDVPFPEGYRHWTFLHSSMVSATFGDFARKPFKPGGFAKPKRPKPGGGRER